VGDKLKKPGDSAFVAIDLAGLGHHFVLELVRTGGDEASEMNEVEKSGAFVSEKLMNVHLNARIVQCWIKNSLGGYSVSDWLLSKQPALPKSKNYSPARFTWMSASDLQRFCGKMDVLKTTLQRIAAENLVQGAAHFCNVNDANALRTWASAEKTNLLLQPGKLEMVDSYCYEMQADGFPEHAVVFTGLTAGNPVQLLDFPARDLKVVMELVRELFSADVSASTFFSMLEWWKDPVAWSYSVLGDVLS
jgi:hypothetical protein